MTSQRSARSREDSLGARGTKKSEPYQTRTTFGGGDAVALDCDDTIADSQFSNCKTVRRSFPWPNFRSMLLRPKYEKSSDKQCPEIFPLTV